MTERTILLGIISEELDHIRLSVNSMSAIGINQSNIDQLCEHGARYNAGWTLIKETGVPKYSRDFEWLRIDAMQSLKAYVRDQLIKSGQLPL